MNYQYKYINKQIELNSTDYTLFIYDLNGGDESRIQKSFGREIENLDEEYLRKVAVEEIRKYTLEKQLADELLAQPQDEVIPDGESD